MRRSALLLVVSAVLLMGAQCSPTGSGAKEIPPGTYRGVLAGTSQMLDQNNQVLDNGTTSSTVTLVIDSANKPVSMNVQASGNAPSQTLTAFTVGATQRIQYSYNDPQNGQVNVDYTLKAIQADYGTNSYVVDYEFTGTQTSSFGVTTLFGKNKYELYNQGDTAAWVIHTQSSTLTAPGGQGIFKSTVFETGLLPVD